VSAWTKDEFERVFTAVIELVEAGHTISGALKKLQVNSNKFYKYLSNEQHVTLDQTRVLNTLYGGGSVYARKKR